MEAQGRKEEERRQLQMTRTWSAMAERNLHILKLPKLLKVATNLIDSDVTGKVLREQLVVWIGIRTLLVSHCLQK